MIDNNINQVLQYLNEEELITLVQKLISIPSYHGLPDNEKELAEYINKYFEEEGIDSQLVNVTGDRPNVIGSYGNNENYDKTLILNGHLDTVGIENMIIDPFKGYIQDGNIYGRGAVDMKGAVAAMIMALVVIKRAGIELEGGLYFTGVIDEEYWNLGTKHIIKHGPKSKYAIVGEPTNLEIHNGHRGLEWIQVFVEGKYAHGGTPEKGINAIEKMNKIISEIVDNLLPDIKKRNHTITGPAALNLGVIKGGTQPSTVAGDCILQLDRRWIPGESPESITDEIKEIIKKLQKDDPELKGEVSIMRNEGNDEGFPYLVCESSAKIVQSLMEATSNIMNSAKISYFPAWTDGALLSHIGGMETVVFGPGDLASAHSEKEFCPIEDIINACKVYVYTILDICG